MSLNVLFCLTDSPKLKVINFQLETGTRECLVFQKICGHFMSEFSVDRLIDQLSNHFGCNLNNNEHTGTHVNAETQK